MTTIKIYHKDWIDDIILNENINPDLNRLERISDNRDIGKYILNNNLLIIQWDRWGSEYFFKKYNNTLLLEYYQITDDYIFDLHEYIAHISIIENDNNINSFIIDINNKSIYYKNNLNYLCNLDKLIDNKYYIYFNYKYYESNYFYKIYSIINIYGIEHVICNNSDVFYLNNNKYISGNYIKYKNKIKLKINNEEIIYINYINNNYKLFIINNSTIYKVNDEILMNNIILFINHNRDIFDIISIINYYDYFNINYFIIDNIDNLTNNIILDDIDIIYYNNFEDLSIFIQKNSNEKIFLQTNNITLFDDFTNKNLQNKFYITEYNKLFNIIEYNEDKIKEDYLKNLWGELNKNNLDKYQFLFDIQNNGDNENEILIPKIIHFIWIGNNSIPNEYIYYLKSWLKNHEDYTFCFWNDSNIPILVNQKYYDEANSFAMKADILRYELLYFFGGIYIDTDFLCIKNIDNLIKDCIGFSGYESNEYIAIGLMGFIKYDNILFKLITKLSYNIISSKSTCIPEITGPIYFTKIWNKYKSNKHIAYPIDYFYSYTFNDKINNKRYSLNETNYAIHMWGYSWSKDNIFNVDNTLQNKYYLTEFYLDNIIKSDINKIKYNDISRILKNEIHFYNLYKKNIHKKKIVHIMGMFFTGGIERYLYYIDKYGSHEEYQYYILYIQNDNIYETKMYDIQNMIMISYDWNHIYLNELLYLINPDLIIDHYSLYLNNNNEIYERINRNNVIYFVHSAICYDKDISELNINKCIHLYNEINKHLSWSNIEHNYYITLGTEINTEMKHINIDMLNNNIKKNKKIHLSIIGRIAEEKIPILFLKKLCKLSNFQYENIEIHIYGEKDYIFNKKYIEEFEEIIIKSKIIVHDFIHPNDLKDIFLITDVLLIPSKYETGSFTCIEAFSYGIPVIARNVYGLKYLIDDKITGYLCNNDKELLSIIKNIKNDNILKNRRIIFDNSLKYNIINKINDIESIIDENCHYKNLVIITSVLNISDLPLSYYHTRSIFTLEERFKQTMKTISSLQKYIPNIEILFCECSDINIEMENSIKEKVNYYHNFYNIKTIRENVKSKFKGLGEAHILLEGMNKINCQSYKNIFKISGRYYLNTHFDYNQFNNNYNIFTNWDDSNKSVCTLFYKLNINYLDLFKSNLYNSLNKLEEGYSIEQVTYNFFSKYIIINDKLNISGFLSTEGYLFSI